MKRIKKETLIAAIFILCIMIFFVGLIPTWYSAHKRSTSPARGYDNISIDWEKEYPFDSAAEEKTAGSDKDSLLNRYLSAFTLLKQRSSSMVKNGTVAKYPLSELYCKLIKIMGYKRVESEDSSVLVLENGYFSYQSPKDMTTESEILVERLSEFQGWLNSQNIQYLYVMEPCKTSPVNEDNIYEGYTDYQKYNMETFAEMMEASDVCFLNLYKPALQAENFNELFYRTDHHWKPSTALWASKILAQYLNENYDFQIDVSKYALANFQAIDYGRCFLGSQGKKITLGFTEPDDFELLLPDYDTELHVKIPSLGIDKEGTLYETLIDKYQLREERYPDKYYSMIQYAAYGYGDRPLITIENNSIANDSKVLILKDSYVNSLGPFFALGVKNTALVDLRHFTGSIRAYIQEYQPDIVITILNGGSHDLSADYELHKNIVDYR